MHKVIFSAYHVQAIYFSRWNKLLEKVTFYCQDIVIYYKGRLWIVMLVLSFS